MNNDEARELPIRRLARREEGAASAVLARAFRHDPLVAYYFADEELGEQRLIRVFGFAVRYALLEGEIYGVGERLEGVAAWLPPGNTSLRSWAALRAGGAGLAMALGPRVTSRTERYGQFARTIHHKHMKEPHWYLYVLGVDPAHQSTGLAGALVRPMTRRFDAHGRSCYLETHNPRNIPIYRHFGFQVAEEVQMPGSGVTHWAMVREPGQRG
jgi:ribosomal protein S18 acetylase RimI-like enzyme